MKNSQSSQNKHILVIIIALYLVLLFGLTGCAMYFKNEFALGDKIIQQKKTIVSKDSKHN